MNTLRHTEDWFKQAVPVPTGANLQVQLGCHLEEVVEMLAALQGVDEASAVKLAVAKTSLHTLAEGLKAGGLQLAVTDRTEVYDGILDQIVTATGVGHMLALPVEEGLQRVNTSNYSKFVNGKPLFKSNGKIDKGPDFKKPDFGGLL